MAENYGWQFFVVSEFIGGIRGTLLPPLSGKSAPANALSIAGNNQLSGLGSIFHNPDEKGEWLNEEEQDRINKVLDVMRDVCSDVAINNIGPEITRLSGYLPSRKRSSLLISIDHLVDRIVDDLNEILFVHINNDRKQFYKNDELFRTEVGNKFPKLREDISNAGTCYALGQNTACVFHLMRVMEHCVQRFGKKLKVDIDTKSETWHQIKIHVHGKIGQLPGGRKASSAQNNRKSSLASAAARLDHVRIAWRNDVMHPKDTYDAEQALEVITSVGTFLKSVVHLL